VLVPGTVLAVGPVRGVGAWPGGRVEAPVRRGRPDGVADPDGLRTVACPDGLPSGAADHGAEAWGGRPPAAPGRPPAIQVECSGATMPKTAAAVTPARVADNAIANARRSLTKAARIARRPPAGPVSALRLVPIPCPAPVPCRVPVPRRVPTLAGPGLNRRLPFGTIPLFR